MTCVKAYVTYLSVFSLFQRRVSRSPSSFPKDGGVGAGGSGATSATSSQDDSCTCAAIKDKAWQNKNILKSTIKKSFSLSRSEIQ